MLWCHHEFRRHADVFRKPRASPPHVIKLNVVAEISLGADIGAQGTDDLPILQSNHVVASRIKWLFNRLSDMIGVLRVATHFFKIGGVAKPKELPQLLV
jgi:hypothetical protein